MRNLNLGSRLYLLIGTGLLAGGVSSLFLLTRLSAQEQIYDRLLDTEVHQQDAARVMQVAFEKEAQEWKNTLLRGHNPQDFKTHRQAFSDGRIAVSKAAANLQASVSDPQVESTISEFIRDHEMLGRKYDDALRAFEQSDRVDVEAADAMVKEQDRQPSELCDAIVGQLDYRVHTAQASQAALILAQGRVVAVGLPLCLGLVAIASVLMARAITKLVGGIANDLRASSEQVVSAAAQVSTSAQSLSVGAADQAAALEENSASMEELASMTRKNAETALRVATLIRGVSEQVQASNGALGEMVTSMTSIQESSSKVSKIIKTIDEIAFQTNILALNAAVEAARAGEAGLGFAVVADEVRNLAQRCAQAAKDTAGLIEESIARSQEGVARVERVGSAIAAITEGVSQVTGLVEEVREASHQQTRGIDQVTRAIAQIEKVTQATAATAEENAAASEELNGQAGSAMGGVQRLEQLVSASGATVAWPAPRPVHVRHSDAAAQAAQTRRTASSFSITAPISSAD